MFHSYIVIPQLRFFSVFPLRYVSFVEAKKKGKTYIEFTGFCFSFWIPKLGLITTCRSAQLVRKIPEIHNSW